MAADSADTSASSTSTASEEASKSSSSDSVESGTYEDSTIAVNTAQKIPSDYGNEESDEKITPTLEQLLSFDRQKHDPPSYYHEPSLNKGPVDKVPRLCNVSSQYAIDGLQIYSAMDDVDQQYKLKAKALFEYERFEHLPAETANGIDHSQIYYEGEDLYFRD